METTRFLRTASRVASAALASGAFLIPATALPVRTVQAHPIYALETGLPCGQCHVNPGGGGPRTAFGRASAANGHRLPGGLRDRYGYYSPPRHGYPGGMMGGYGPHGEYGPGMMGGYGPGPGMMGPGMMGW